MMLKPEYVEILQKRLGVSSYLEMRKVIVEKTFLSFDTVTFRLSRIGTIKTATIIVIRKEGTTRCEFYGISTSDTDAIDEASYYFACYLFGGGEL